MRVATLFVALVLAGLCPAQKVTAPQRIDVDPSGWPEEVEVANPGKVPVAVVNCHTKNVKFVQVVSPNPDAMRFLVAGRLPANQASAEFEVVLMVNGAKDSAPVEASRIIVAVKGPQPPPQPPGPLPPTPPPPPGPPDNPPPIAGDGFRVLIRYETADKLPLAQRNVLLSQTIRNYLNSHCVKANGQPSYAILDKDTPVADFGEPWVSAMARPQKSAVEILISNGKTGFAGPLPGTAEEALKLLKQYGGD